MANLGPDGRVSHSAGPWEFSALRAPAANAGLAADEALISYAVTRCYAGLRGGALKRGRNPRYPYVPIIYHPAATDGRGHRKSWQEQVRARAFAARDEAVAYANETIHFRRDLFEKRLRDPLERALRRQWADEFARAALSTARGGQ